MKSQVATEYLIIVSFALMVLIPFILYLTNVSQNFSEDNTLTVASDSVQKIGQTADLVYSRGEPAKLTISILIPANVQEINFTNKTMTWKVRTSSGVSDVYYNSVANLTGNLSTTPGYYNVIVEATVNATGRWVNITRST
jgi:uncharacterized protein (UPF0333 family)